MHQLSAIIALEREQSNQQVEQDTIDLINLAPTTALQRPTNTDPAE